MTAIPTDNPNIMVARACEDRISATVVSIYGQSRKTYDGDGFDIYWEGTVLRTRDDTFGTHDIYIRGGKRHPNGPHCSLDQGTYDMEFDMACKDFVYRMKRHLRRAG